MDRSSKQKINKEIQVLNDTLDEMDLIDIFRTFHPKAEYTSFSSAHGTFSRIDYIMGHKSNLSKFKKIEIVSTIFSDHNTIRLDINYKGKSVKNTNSSNLTKRSSVAYTGHRGKGRLQRYEKYSRGWVVMEMFGVTVAIFHHHKYVYISKIPQNCAL